MGTSKARSRTSVETDPVLKMRLNCGLRLQEEGACLKFGLIKVMASNGGRGLVARKNTIRHLKKLVSWRRWLPLLSRKSTHGLLSWTLEQGMMLVLRAELLLTVPSNTEKVGHLLREIDKSAVPCFYVCLDLSMDSVKEGVAQLLTRGFGKVQVSGICGTFDNGLNYLRNVPNQRVALWLGSTFFSDSKPDLSPTVWSTRELMRVNDFMIVGQDCHTMDDASKIKGAYHNEAFHDFIAGAVKELNNSVTHCYILETTSKLTKGATVVEKGTRFKFFPSRKLCVERMEKIFGSVGLRLQSWQARATESCECVFTVTGLS